MSGWLRPLWFQELSLVWRYSVQGCLPESRHAAGLLRIPDPDQSIEDPDFTIVAWILAGASSDFNFEYVAELCCEPVQFVLSS